MLVSPIGVCLACYPFIGMLRYVILMLVCILFLVTLKMIYVVLWEICNSCIGFGLVSDIARAYFSQLKFVHLMRSFTCGMSIAGFRHVDSWGVSEHWATGGAYVKVICDITGSRIGAGLIDREAILIFSSSKNLEIHDVKQSENISGYLFSSFICFYSGCSVSSEICPDCDSVNES